MAEEREDFRETLGKKIMLKVEKSHFVTKFDFILLVSLISTSLIYFLVV